LEKQTDTVRNEKKGLLIKQDKSRTQNKINLDTSAIKKEYVKSLFVISSDSTVAVLNRIF
jgi:hypothetical protein